MPERIQRRRCKGWRMPAGAVSVTRPGKFGNPFTVDDARKAGYIASDDDLARWCVMLFREWLGGSNDHYCGPVAEKRRAALLAGLPELRGKNLACYCAIDGPCHADILLELANR